MIVFAITNLLRCLVRRTTHSNAGLHLLPHSSSLSGCCKGTKLGFRYRPEPEPRHVETVILIDDVHVETVRLVNFAKAPRTPCVRFMSLLILRRPNRSLRSGKQRIGEGKLEIIESPYRLLAEPIHDYITRLQREKPGCFVHIIMGHLAMDTYWGRSCTRIRR